MQEAKKQAEKQRQENTKLKEERGGLEHRVQDLERKLERAKHLQVQPISGQLVRRSGRTLTSTAAQSSTGVTADAQAGGLDLDADAADTGAGDASFSLSLMPRGAAAAHVAGRPRSPRNDADGAEFVYVAASQSQSHPQSAPSTTSKALPGHSNQQLHAPASQPPLGLHSNANPNSSRQTGNALQLRGAGASVPRSQSQGTLDHVSGSGATVRTLAGPQTSTQRGPGPHPVPQFDPRLGHSNALAPGYGDDGDEAEEMDPLELDTVAETIDPLAQHAAVATMRQRQAQQPITELRFGSVSQSLAAQAQRPLHSGTAASTAAPKQNGSVRLPQASRPNALTNGSSVLPKATAGGSSNNPQAKTMPLPGSATGAARAPALKVLTILFILCDK